MLMDFNISWVSLSTCAQQAAAAATAAVSYSKPGPTLYAWHHSPWLREAATGAPLDATACHGHAAHPSAPSPATAVCFTAPALSYCC
jgi:hypothetical protein